MFGIVSNIVVGLLRSMFGIRQSATSSSNTQIGSSTNYLEVAVANGRFDFFVSGAWVYSIRSDGTYSPAETQVIWTHSNGQLGTADTGLERLAAGLIGTTDGSTGTGWIQNSAGSSKVALGGGTNVTITPADTGLSVTLKAGRKYHFKVILWVTETTAADGLRVDFDGGTATMTSFRQNGYVSDTVSVRPLAQTTALATDVTDTTTTGAAMAVFEGTLLVNAGGTFVPRYAKEADAAGAAITLNDAVMLVEDMP